MSALTWLLGAWALGATIASHVLWLDRNLFQRELRRVAGELAREKGRRE